MNRRTSRRRTAIAAVALGLTLTLTGCEWNGLNSVPLPGTEGGEDGSYTVKIEMPNVTTLSQNSPVRVNDVTVGTISGIEVDGWHALVTVSLNPDVELPANATAKIGQTSLLGSQHLELAPPIGIAPQGTLQDGDLIPIERAGAFPTTEQTLSSLSVVLNGGGLAQLNDITSELNAALLGREESVRDLVPQLDQLVGSLDNQRGQIVSAMEGIDRLSTTVNQQTATLTAALEGIPPALEVLAGQRQNITSALVSLGQFSDVATRVINQSGDDLKANLHALAPLLKELADTGSSLTDVLMIALTYPFPLKNLDQVIRGDYANLMMTVDLTNKRLDSNFLTGTGLGGTLGGIEGALGKTAGVAGQASNPLASPKPKPAAPADAKAEPKPPAAPLIPGLSDIPGLSQIPGLQQLGATTP